MYNTIYEKNSYTCTSCIFGEPMEKIASAMSSTTKKSEGNDWVLNRGRVRIKTWIRVRVRVGGVTLNVSVYHWSQKIVAGENVEHMYIHIYFYNK